MGAWHSLSVIALSREDKYTVQAPTESVSLVTEECVCVCICVKRKELVKM